MKWDEVESAWVDKALPFSVRRIDAPVAEILGKIVRNPHYGKQDAGIYGWCYVPLVQNQRKPGFQTALRESIAREGVRNPVVGYQTPVGLFVSFGQSRARAAQDLGLETIPMIVNDYTGRWGDAPVVTKRNWSDFFTDVPEWHEFTITGFDYHYSLERNRRHQFDPAGLEWVKGQKEAPWLRREFSWLADET